MGKFKLNIRFGNDESAYFPIDVNNTDTFAELAFQCQTQINTNIGNIDPSYYTFFKYDTIPMNSGYTLDTANIYDNDELRIGFLIVDVTIELTLYDMNSNTTLVVETNISNMTNLIELKTMLINSFPGTEKETVHKWYYYYNLENINDTQIIGNYKTIKVIITDL